MNILLITQTLSAGGSERTVAKLSKLYAQYSKVFILVIDGTRNIDFEYAGTLLFLKDFMSGKSVFLLNKVKAVRQIKKRFNIHVTISFLEGPNFTNILSRCGDKVYVSVRGHKSSFYKKAGKKWLIEKLAIRLLYNRSNGVIAASQGIAEDLVNQLGVAKEKVSTIPNYYDFEDICAKSKESTGSYETLLHDHQVIIANGRLSVPKGYHHLLKIFHELRKRKAGLKLIIMGDGELYEDLVEMVKELGMNLHTWKEGRAVTASFDVYLTGFVNNPFCFLSRASVFAFTSLWEGFPNALAEAIICGIPVVSSDCMSGPRELMLDDVPYNSKQSYPMQSQYGILLPAFNISGESSPDIYELWVRGLDKMLESNRKKQLNTVQDFRERFGKEAVSSSWLKLLH